MNHFGRLNKLDTEVRVWILKMASARMGATDRRTIFSPSYSSPWRGGIELVIIILSMSDLLMFSKAFPEKRPWVAKQRTDKAPCCFRALEASLRVPAVSMISSMMMACLFSTDPTKCILPIFPAPSLCLIIIARLQSLTPTESINPRNFLALATPPASGDTTTISFISRSCCSTKQFMATICASRLSTGTLGPKNPWIWPECTSTNTTRSTPTVSNNLATSAAEMGTRGAVFLSWRAQPQQGMMTLIFLAEARRIVETISNSSTRFSLTGGQVDCMMYMFLLLTFSLTSILTSPSANLPTLISPR